MECGATPVVLLEDAFDSRLEAMKEVEPGRVIYWCEKTDVIKARQVMGQTACIMGGMPVSLLIAGNPQQIKDRVRTVLEGAARDGGFILSTSTSIDNACPEANVRAFFEAADEFGQQV